MDSYFLVPHPGYTVVDPATGDKLPASGKDVAKSNHWDRMIGCGMVTRAEKPALAQAKSERKTKKK